MKVKELKLDQEVIINGYTYSYKGVNKVKMNGYKVQKILFKGKDINSDKHFDLNVGNKDVKEVNGVIELK